MKLLPALILTLLLPSAALSADKETLFQVASIESLLQGVYNTGISCGELLEHGNLGLGTFENLDGEMAVLDGVVWQIRADGSVSRAPDGMGTPFACVTDFQQDRLLQLENVKNFDDLAERIRQAVSHMPNMIYALRAQANFTHIRTRSVPRQKRPFPPLLQALKDQPEFEFTQQPGDIMGFYLPPLLAGLNVPGLHLHFLTKERNAGGHVLELQAEKLELQLDATPGFAMLLPQDPDFQQAPLDAVTGDELHKVER